MKSMKNLTVALLALSLPLTTLPLTSSTTALAATNSQKAEKHTYTGNGSVKKMTKTAYHSKDSKGNIYSALFMADKPTVELTKKTTLNQYRTTWYATKKMSVRVDKHHSRTYYYVTSSDKKVSGWTWSGYLTKGIFKSAD
ncbi:hypothetical protein [Companilactobacillus nantensis]|nr:hypothetical protein [Companilactobacillus nantensis]GEO62990.1 hypothetical protein LNA01_01730 [Companilactobacillus nantensis]